MSLLVKYRQSVSRTSSNTLEDSGFWDKVEQANLSEEALQHLLKDGQNHFSGIGFSDQIITDEVTNKPKLRV